MSLPEDTPLPPDPGRKTVVIWWDEAEQTFEIDSPGVSWLDVSVLLQLALDEVEQYLPVPINSDQESETEE